MFSAAGRMNRTWNEQQREQEIHSSKICVCLEAYVLYGGLRPTEMCGRKQQQEHGIIAKIAMSNATKEEHQWTANTNIKIKSHKWH